jgi:hypothetical protein
MSLLQAITRAKQHLVDQRRENVHFAAWTDIDDGSEPRCCTISDVSNDGARITLPRPRELPSEFWLVLTQSGQRCRCRMVWSSGKELGVSYLGPPQSPLC